MLLNCGVGEDSWESLGLQRDQTQSILKEINPEYSLEGLMLKLKLQYFGHLMWRTDTVEKTLILGMIEGGRRRGQQRMRQLDGITNPMGMILSKLQEIVLDRVLKSGDITLPTKVCIVKAVVFPLVMYGCESWTIKKTECQRIDAFELWCWRRLLRVPWTSRRSNQSIQNEISPEYSLEGLMLKLKLQYFGYLIQRTDSLEMTLMLGKIEGRRRRER